MLSRGVSEANPRIDRHHTTPGPEGVEWHKEGSEGLVDKTGTEQLVRTKTSPIFAKGIVNYCTSHAELLYFTY